MTIDPHHLDDITDRVRTICLALPKAVEKEAWGDATFRVGDKIFAMIKTGDGRVSVWSKAPPGSQQVLVGADPETFFVPPYVGPKGWVGMRLDRKPDWAEVERFIVRSYGLVAPKRLAVARRTHGPTPPAAPGSSPGSAPSPQRGGKTPPPVSSPVEGEVSRRDGGGG